MSREVEGLVRAQNELFGRISRAYENLKKSASSVKLTLGLVEARLHSLETNWAKFEAQHDKLLTQDGYAELDYVKQDVPTLAEEAFVQQKGMILDIIKSLRKREDPETTPEAKTTPPRTTLPRIQLPNFSGKYEDWPAFRDLFQSLIGKDPTTTPVEKFHYLKVCLKGEPEILIRNLTTTGENYERAWTTLRAYYENKRLLVRAYISNFIALQKMKVESADELRKMVHGLKATVNSLEGIGRPIANSEDLFVYLAIELLDPRSRREWETAISDTIEPPTLGELEQFLDRRLHALESMAPIKTDGTTAKAGSGTSKSTRNHLAQKQGNKSENKQGRCASCQKDHYVLYCDAYKKKTAQERKQFVEEKDLCVNCLGRHKVSDCASKRNCSACSARHHTSLHDACRAAEIGTTTLLTQGQSNQQLAVLLATARIRVADRFGTLHAARALVDQGSESTLISERLAQRLRLPRSAAAVTVFGVGGKKTGVAKGRVKLSVSPRTSDVSMRVSAIVLPRLTIYTGGVKAEPKSWPHLRGLELADPEFFAANPIDVILGADAYAVILCRGVRKGGSREPVAQHTTLGWILSGEIGTVSSGHYARSHPCRIEEDLATMVRRLWEQEELPATAIALSAEERKCEDHFALTHSREADGRYTVRLPFKAPLPDLSGTRRTAERVLRQMEKRFDRDAAFHELYAEFMLQYSELQHMTPIFSGKQDEDSKVCYLPHHGVMRDSSSTTKLRVVFNGSSVTPSGETLNRYLHTGPNLLPALPDILLRWRRHRFVLATDIEKMYRQINVHPKDRDWQRILWRYSPDDEILAFKLNTVTYGLACAPFLAIRTLRQLADDENTNFPVGAAVLRQEVYMDDILTGASSLEATQEIQEQLTQICTAGGFPLKKWSANDAALLETLPVEDRLQKEPRWWRSGESHSTLGLRWHPHDDHFSFAIPPIKMETVTKRTILALTARLFDPLGWLSPTTLRAKVWIQSTWLLGIDWDSPLPDEDTRRWLDFQAELPVLEAIRVPRWLTMGIPGRLAEIHGFSDASERGYAAVVYLRTTDADDQVEIRLMASKTKVAPLKQITLPRLELCAAALLARLVGHIRDVLEIQEASIHLWSDSTVALGWIQGHPSTWKTYVANRVSEIQTTLPDACWHYIRGIENPADCASRGLSPQDLVSHPLWWTGPPWLSTETGRWAASSEERTPAELPDRRVRIHQAGSKEIVEPDVLGRYSSLTRLLRITAWCLRWPRRSPAMRSSSRNDGVPADAPVLRATELEGAQRNWVRIVQAKHFERDLTALDKGKPLPTHSRLTSLSPFKDSQGILRVGGRLRHAKLSFDQKHPAILPGGSQFTRLVIDAYHRRTLHGGVQLTLGLLRQDFWVPRGRALVKSCLRRCLPCLRWRAASPQPPMGDLPAARVTPARPFLTTGVDYAGPVWIRTSKGRGHRASKAFIVVFICLSSRAVHLDVASDYSADAFLAALRRFVSRRGLCRVLHSDCGTNFVGADAQLRHLFTASSREGQRLAAHLAEEKIQWRFNPPAAPNFGGIWEAAVKSAKYHLRRVIGDATLTYEEMATLLAQVEACLNSRPLQALSDDPEDLTALTPGHFLIGSALIAIPEPSLAEEPVNRLSRWQLLQSMRDHFWKRWAKEYLHTLAHRPKWTKEVEEIRVGRLCLLRSEATPPLKWPLARIEQVHPGADGQTRVVSIRTSTTSLTRPVNKLVLLPISGAPEDAAPSQC